MDKMEQISSRKLEEANASSEHLFKHLQDDSKLSMPRSRACSRKACIFGSVLSLLFVVSTAALLVSAAALWSVQTNGRLSGHVQAHTSTFEDNEELNDQLVDEDEAQLVIHGRIPSEEASFENAANRDPERRSAEQESNFCISSSNQTYAKPLAHIVGEGVDNFRETPKVRGRGTHSVITANWKCDSESRNQGNVQGGMIFDRSTGTLQLPTAGVYYIYYNVAFRQRVSDQNSNNPLEISCRVVGCKPEQQPTCNFNSARTTYSYMQSTVQLNASSVLSQGGLLYFPAGSKVAIVADHASRRAPQLYYDDHPLLTYFGAFLVDADP